MIPQENLPRQALFEAIHFRQAINAEPWKPICVFDASDRIGIEVRFVDIPSMEGMYWNSCPPRILVSSHRPPGRQAYTCAHELAHHLFGHGARIDEVLHGGEIRNSYDPEEFLADCFAGFLLMPKSAVCQAFSARGWSLTDFTCAQAYVVAGQLGVGYSTLIHHMHRSLQLISPSIAKEFLRTKPTQIRAAIIGDRGIENLIVVDKHWNSRPIDIQVADFILAPGDARFEGKCAILVEPLGSGLLFRGTSPGIGRFCRQGDWASFVRVSRRNYVGRSTFRHLEEPQDE